MFLNKNVAAEKGFLIPYKRAMLMAALTFGLVHGVQSLIWGFINNKSLSLKLTALVTLVGYETLASLLFLLVGFPVAYVPSRIVARAIDGLRKNRAFPSIFSGAIMGIIFLPLCITIPFRISPWPDDPGYLGRCAEFILPMMLAGAVGGYAFWSVGFANSKEDSTAT